MESDRYICTAVSRAQITSLSVTLVSRDVKLARQVASIVRTKKALCTVNLVDPVLYLVGMCPTDDPQTFVDEGSLHWADTHYFLDGMFRPEVDLDFPLTFKKKKLRDSIDFYIAVRDSE